MERVQLTINGAPVEAFSGQTILEAAIDNAIYIPTLCHHPDLCTAGNCRICAVEIQGARVLQTACTTPVSRGMEIQTNSPKVRKARKDILELMLADHEGDCKTCRRSLNCELQELAERFAISDTQYDKSTNKPAVEEVAPSLVRDNGKCILCMRCVRTCEELQGISVIRPAGRSTDTRVAAFFDKPLSDVACAMCGQCINRCPTGALRERDATEAVWAAIEDPKKHVVVQTAPAVRAALGEDLGIPPGERVTGKMVAAIRRLGVDRVFDTDFTADLTIMEEGHELLGRLKKALVDKDQSVALPMMTSCSPGWIKFAEHYFPELLPNLSTCKSPQQMFGALVKTYYAEKAGIDPKDVVSVSVMPCVAKKYECDRPEMNQSGYKDVDYVLTTRELAKMIWEGGIDFHDLPVESFDAPLGISSGAAVIFGSSGGVMEAAIRTAYEVVTGKEVPFKNLDIHPLRGLEGAKEAELPIQGAIGDWAFLDGATLKVAVVNSLGQAKALMRRILAGEADYHFIEIMACPGGCLGGGGQPIPTDADIRSDRMEAIYEEDSAMILRKSHDNPAVLLLYKEFLGEPNGHKAHELLHTHYTPRNKA